MAVKFFSTEYEGGASGGRVEVNQVTKMNIVATKENPHISTIGRKFDNKFDRLPVEILKAVEGETVVEVLAQFDNSDKDDFKENPYIGFDGVMKIKTDYEFQTKIKEDGIYDFDLNKLDIFGDEIISLFCEEVDDEALSRRRR